MNYRVDYVIADGHEDRFSVEVWLDDEMFMAILERDADGSQRTWVYPRRDGEPWALTISELNALVTDACRRLEPKT